jgi:hypothetical protein
MEKFITISFCLKAFVVSAFFGICTLTSIAQNQSNYSQNNISEENKKSLKSPKKSNKIVKLMSDGGWCWYQDPRAVISKGKLIIAGLSGVSGDVRIGVYDLKNEKMLGELTLHKDFERDDHNVPALHVRPDGSILAVWAKHSVEKKHYYSISDPNDYLEWGETKTFTHDYEGKQGVTYMNLLTIKNERLLYNIFRDGLNYNPTFITSTDEGATWKNRTHFIANDVSGFQRPYARYFQKDENTIGISYSDAHPREYGNSLYYAEYHDGGFYTVSGKKIKELTEGPLKTKEGEKIYTGSETKVKPKGADSVPNSAWTSTMSTDKKGNPVIGYTVTINDHDHRYRMATWNGKKWIDREVAYAGDGLYPAESSYTGLITLDPTNPKRAYISTEVNPKTGEPFAKNNEIYTAKIKNGADIKNIKWKPLTANSNHKNLRPMVVAGEGYKVVMWLNGPWATYKDYDSNVMGIVLEKP